ALRAVPGVADAAVVVRDDQLAGYVVTATPEEPTPAAIRSALHGKLPSYMVPSVIALLPELPLTPNRKLDRSRLPGPVARAAGTPQVEPRDAVEIALARIWSELLGVDRVGVHDDFFDLGGHSLLSVRLVAAMQREWNVDVAVADLLRHPTIA